MFVRYEFDKTATNNTTNHQNFLSDLQNIINGTITDPANITSDYCNKELSEIVGSCNYGTAVTNLYNISYTSAYEFRVEKHHNNRDNTALYNPKSELRFYWNYGSRPSARNYASDGGAIFSTSNVNNYWTADTGTGQAEQYITDNPSYDRCLMYISDYWFVIQLYNGARVMTAGIMDFEDSSADQYTHSIDNVYTPQVNFEFDIQSMTSGLTSQQALYWGKNHYMMPTGSIQTGTSTYSVEQFLGNVTTISNYTATMSPTPRVPVNSAKISGGAGHFMIPVFFIGSAGNSTSSIVGTGKIPYFYRTTDDLAQGGDSVTLNAVEYAVMPLHKTSGDGETTCTLQATYLVPKTIGGA